MPRVGIIAGVAAERAALADILAGPEAPMLRLSGARADGACAAAEALIAAGVDGLLSFGTAGGLAPGMMPGTLIVAERVLSPAGGDIRSDPVWTQGLAAALGVRPSTIVGVDGIAGTAEKARLHQATGAVAADMESHLAAAAAARAGLPFAVLRAVVDPADFEVPAWIGGCIKMDGGIDGVGFAFGLLRNPGSLPALIALGGYNRDAVRALRGAVRTVGPGFGLFAGEPR